MKRVTADQLQAICARYREMLLKSNGDAAEVLARVGTRMETAIVRKLLTGDYKLSMVEMVRLQRAMQAIIADGNDVTLKMMQQHVPDVARITMQRTAETIAAAEGVTAFNRVTGQRIVEVFDHFDKAIKDRRIIQIAEPYLTRWAAQWDADWQNTARQIQAALTRGAVTGQSNQVLAKGLVDEIGRLNIQGRIPIDSFAQSFVRTASAELYNNIGMSLATEAGLEQFVNIGVADSRQSEECYEASNWGAHTLAEWEASPWGPPLRHVMNCRCELVGITDYAAKNLDLKQPNPKFDEAKKEVTV